MATARHIVVLAHTEPQTVDALAAALREDYTVRTAYERDGLFDSLDGEVDIVLVDPALTDLEALRERRGEEGQSYQIAALTDGTADDADAVIETSNASAVIKDTVERLVERATYRRALERFYAVAAERAALVADDTDASDELERLDERLAHLERELSEARDALDDQTALETALDEFGT